jgi:hypothetical protein
MAAIDAIVFAGAAGFAVIVIATILVIIGVRQEQAILEREGRRTFAHHEPPSILALLARRVLGAHFQVMPGDLPRAGYPKPEYPDPDYPGPDYLGPDYPDEDPPPDDRPVWPEAG